ncbi:MAG: DNA helicase UvrD, partial [Lachnospiraceae bacterium]|nr:DNA helicase UvrD [Lachnospiraceae bacterium]
MSSDAPKKKLPGKTRRAEEQHLKETLEIIRKNVDRYAEEVAALRTDIDDMQAHFHDDNPELINTLENTYTMYDFQNRTLDRNRRALKKPYFGRIDFYDETLDTDEAFYIGKCGISKDATHPLVIDWRAPVANVYYENGLGKCSYIAPEGHELPIDLKLKRTYEIADGKLLNMFDTEVIANDDLLTSYLSKNKQAVLGEIVATIQKEQNDIIRKSPYHNCLVQGVAGSGKTTVAMHRISYILYNYADRFKPEDFYIVGSNRILLNYITGVLPDLDVYGIKQMTMEQLFVRLLYEDWDEKQYRIKGHETGSAAKRNACKGTLSWFRDLEHFCEKLEQESISCEPVCLNRRQFVEGIVGGKAGVHDLREGNVTIYESD